MTQTVDTIIGHYRRMFGFPRSSVLFIETVSSATIISALISLLTPNIIIVFTQLLVIIIFSQFLSAEISYHIAPSRKLLGRRRSLGLSFATSILTIPAFLIASVAIIPISGVRLVPYTTIIIAASLETYLRYFSLFTYMEISRLRLLAVTLTQPAILLFGSLIVGEPLIGQATPALAGIFSALVIAEFSAYVVKSRAATLSKMNGLSLSRSFFAGWMGEEPEKLEKILETESEVADLEVDLLSIWNGATPKAVLVAPRIHAGPFRKVGSCNLPAALSERINSEYHIPAFVFHGAISHERDLVHSKDVQVVIDAILQGLKQPAGNYDHGAMVQRPPEQMVGGVRFGDRQLLWVSLAPLLSDDLPSQLQADADEYATSLGVGRTSLIDTHSCLGIEQPSSDVFEKLKAQIRLVEDELAACDLSDLEFGAAPISVENFRREEIAGLGGYAGYLKIGKSPLGILLFDSNNMTSALRAQIDEGLPNALGYPVEVFTTDTHALVGIRPKKDYSPLGEMTEDKAVLKQSREALEKAASASGPVTVTSITVTIKGARVLGAKGIEILGDTANVMVDFVRRLLPITIIGCALLTLLYSLVL